VLQTIIRGGRGVPLPHACILILQPDREFCRPLPVALGVELEVGLVPADGGGLPGPRWSAEDGGVSAPAPEGRPEEPGEFPDLHIAVVEVLGEICELKDLGVAEECLIVTEEGRMRHTSPWRRGDC